MSLPDGANRFEVLLGRFFDGELTDAEDKEFAELLGSDAALAKKFIAHARMERLMAGQVSGRAVDDEAFLAAVQRSIDLLADDSESRHFAEEVVQLVKKSGAAKRRTRRTGTPARLAAGQSSAWIVVLSACAAGVVLAVLAWRALSPAERVTPPANNENVVAGNTEKRPSPVPEPHIPPEVVVEPQPLRSTDVVAEQAPRIAPMEERAPEEPKVEPEPESPVAEVPGAKPVPALPDVDAQGRFSRVAGVIAEVQRGTETVRATLNTQLAAGDTIRILAPAESPSENTPAPRSEITLKDGTVLALTIGTSLRLQMEKNIPCPHLLQGEISASVKPHAADAPFRVLTAQGPAVEVVGTVFRVAANPTGKRVTLRVDEGRVLFRNAGVERKVSVDEGCDAEDGKAPGAPYQYRPRPAAVAGTVIDKATGKPIAGAEVRAMPAAQRRSGVSWPSVKTDANGRYKLTGLPEGVAFLLATAEDSVKGNGLLQRATSGRAKLIQGETAAVNIAVDRAALVLGKIVEGGKLLADYRVRFVPSGTDGLSPLLKLQNIIHPDTEYRCIVTDPAGKYVPIVEKPGLCLKVRGGRPLTLQSDMANLFTAEVIASPSAVIKGRVVAKGGKPLIDEPGAKLENPTTPRSVVTLNAPSGQVHMLLAEADGTFQFNTNLEPGGYDLRVERFGFSPATSRFTLSAGQTSEFDVPMEAVRH